MFSFSSPVVFVSLDLMISSFTTGVNSFVHSRSTSSSPSSSAASSGFVALVVVTEDANADGLNVVVDPVPNALPLPNTWFVDAPDPNTTTPGADGFASSSFFVGASVLESSSDLIFCIIVFKCFALRIFKRCLWYEKQRCECFATLRMKGSVSLSLSLC